MAVAGGPLPLAPYRVLDLTERFGALCGRILGDLGAQVIKIERPGGDPARRLPPFADGLPGPTPASRGGRRTTTSNRPSSTSAPTTGGRS